MIIWKDIPVIIKHKVAHVRKLGGRIRKSIIKDYGDIPVANINEVTGKFEEVVNTRGNAYAARKRLSYRKKIK